MTHLVYGFCVDIAFSNSSSALDFFNFFTKLLTAFSDHFPSIDESSFPFFHANNRFTIGGVKGSIFDDQFYSFNFWNLNTVFSVWFVCVCVSFFFLLLFCYNFYSICAYVWVCECLYVFHLIWFGWCLAVFYLFILYNTYTLSVAKCNWFNVNSAF